MLNSLVTLDSLQSTFTLGTAAQQESVFSFSVPSSFNLGTVECYLSSLTTSFATGARTVDAGWGRSTWGSFAWNENITQEVDVTGVTMATSLAPQLKKLEQVSLFHQQVLSMTGALGTTSQTGTSLETLDSLSVGVALSGVTVSAAGSVAVIAPSDQLDFAIGTPTIEIFTQVDPTAVTAMTAH